MVTIIEGRNDKPAASVALVEVIRTATGFDGECFIGYPIIPTPEGKMTIDAILISPQKGIVLFDLVEGNLDHNYEDRQDDIANKLESKLRLYKELFKGRKAKFNLHVITFCPLSSSENQSVPEYIVANSSNLLSKINSIEPMVSTNDVYEHILSAIEGITSIRKGKLNRSIQDISSLGAKLQKLEDSIATLDQKQAKAVIETVDGVQRIRGLAGSGKTIILALKTAYLHTQFPDWNIAVTFHTRALKAQYKKLITTFCIELGVDPDWNKINIINAWGAPGDYERRGIYYQYCQLTNQIALDYTTAKNRFNNDQPFDLVCQHAIAEKIEPAVYDVILVDEAQDFSSNFLKLCYFMLKAPKRLIYAYDELQNLSGESLSSPEELFGKKQDGTYRVLFADNADKKDIILEKCYRNSRPVLATAHALGFGIYKKSHLEGETGLVQMFDQPNLWKDVGYDVLEGELKPDSSVVLARNDRNSPKFLEEHSTIDELIQFHKFNSTDEQNYWLAEQIEKNISEDELQYNDIIVINPNPIGARKVIGPIRQILFEKNIQSHIAGIDVDQDVFFHNLIPSITFTSIYRAKGNESGMVYIINADECNGSGHGLALLRNQLFTAITRSKAWVRVLGVGSKMSELIDEFETLKQNDFQLRFKYPNAAELKKLKVIHRDISAYEKKKIDKGNEGLNSIVGLLKNGEINIADIDPALLQDLLALIKDNK